MKEKKIIDRVILFDFCIRITKQSITDENAPERKRNPIRWKTQRADSGKMKSTPYSAANTRYKSVAVAVVTSRYRERENYEGNPMCHEHKLSRSEPGRDPF